MNSIQRENFDLTTVCGVSPPCMQLRCLVLGADEVVPAPGGRKVLIAPREGTGRAEVDTLGSCLSVLLYALGVQRIRKAETAL